MFFAHPEHWAPGWVEGEDAGWGIGGFWVAGDVFEYAADGGVTVNVSGAAATGALGTVTQTFDFSYSSTGVAATTALGTTTQAIGVNVGVTGVAATGQLGIVSATGTAVVNATGVQATGQLGTTTQTSSVNYAVTGVAATGQLGSVTQTYSGSVNATGVYATAQLGTVTQTYSGSVNATGVYATTQLGSAATSIIMLQYAYPVSDIATNGWSSTGANLWSVLDETVQDNADYIYSPNNPTTQAFEVALGTLGDPAVGTGHVVYVGLHAVGQDTTFSLSLMQGAAEIDAWDEVVTAGAIVTRGHTLGATEANSITDYSDLRVRGVAHG